MKNIHVVEIEKVMMDGELTEVKSVKYWSSMSVYEMCNRFHFYSCGDNESYNKMFEIVKNNEPSIENIYKVAYDICKHSEAQTIENIMFHLEHYAINHTFEIDW